tara:strand:- start:24988 stop:25353 length:366 start_codon:yes stop_codon:yes gene_type:complete
VFVVTNQSGIGRGLYDEKSVETLHGKMNSDIKTIGAHIDAFEFCPHHPREAQPEFLRECECRKPAPGMLLKLIEKWHIDPDASLMIGDRKSDIAAADAANVRGYLFTENNLYDFVAPLLGN